MADGQIETGDRNYSAIDNTDGGDILRSILWQYDKAPKFCAIIEFLKEAYDKTTASFFNGLVDKLNPNTADDYGLSILAKALWISRPAVTYEVNGVTKTEAISKELFRRLIIGRATLLNGEATIVAYKNYIAYVSDGSITVSDGLEMNLEYSVDGTATPELNALAEQYPDILFAYPSGVKSKVHSDSLMFGLSNDGITPQDTFCGGLDESSFNWRLTPDGTFTE